MAKKKFVGYIAIDTARIIICDPAHIGYIENALWGESDHPLTGESSIEGYQIRSRCCEPNPKGKTFESGIISDTGLGDGLYPVYAETVIEAGVERTMRLIIDFID
jgi:hypothetical protein